MNHTLNSYLWWMASDFSCAGKGEERCSIRWYQQIVAVATKRCCRRIRGNPFPVRILYRKSVLSDEACRYALKSAELAECHILSMNLFWLWTRHLNFDFIEPPPLFHKTWATARSKSWILLILFIIIGRYHMTVNKTICIHSNKVKLTLWYTAKWTYAYWKTRIIININNRGGNSFQDVGQYLRNFHL